ncbi:bifunctional phosphoglucose/phosphomannose isomerase [bacterium]|nr:bifunctional phosphoglucose/phosphomannose isomerase [bacterium]MBU1753021.1 bifunctional phosphoglucose/phosphomannose isomerase [bacterium]
MCIDKSNMLESIKKFPGQFEKSIRFADGVRVDGKINKVVIAGMGGSAFPGDILAAYLKGTNIPVEVCRGYSITTSIDENSLVFVSSFSGNTEETISALHDAREKKAQVVIVTAGGRLEELSREHNLPMAKIVKEFPTFQPRAASGYFMGIFLGVLSNSGVIPNKKADLIEVGNFLAKCEFEEEAKQLAKQLVDCIPVIYTHDFYEMPLARIIKIKFNENSKVQAFFNSFPELNHNEMVGFTNIKAKYHFIVLNDPDGHERITRRIQVFSGLMRDKGLPVSIMEMRGNNVLSKIFGSIYFFEYVSYYLALEYGIDPTPVDMVENFKKAL